MFQKITRQRLEEFLTRHRSSKRVLDIGAGGSAYGYLFPNRLTFDLDPNRKPDIVGDAHSLPFKSGEFEMILCTEVLEHIRDPKVAIAEMYRVLASEGILILTTRFVYPLHDTPHDYWRFTKYGLLELFKEWEIIELTAETKSFSTVAVLLQRIGFQSRLRFNKFSKAIIFLLAYISKHFDFLLKEEYGDIQKSKIEEDIMPSGYYIVCKKSPR